MPDMSTLETGGVVYNLRDVGAPRETDAAVRKRLALTAGGSATITLKESGLYLVSFVDNVRSGCVLMQTANNGIHPINTTLIPLTNWAYSTDGFDLTISETGGQWSGTACVTAVGRGHF